jgi:hypothetical protein
VGLTTLPCKKKIVEKPPRNSTGFCGGGQGLSWAVEPRKEERRIYKFDACICNGMGEGINCLKSGYRYCIVWAVHE